MRSFLGISKRRTGCELFRLGYMLRVQFLSAGKGSGHKADGKGLQVLVTGSI